MNKKSHPGDLFRTKEIQESGDDSRQSGTSGGGQVGNLPSEKVIFLGLVDARFFVVGGTCQLEANGPRNGQF